jgi:hypothetical protein
VDVFHARDAEEGVCGREVLRFELGGLVGELDVGVWEDEGGEGDFLLGFGVRGGEDDDGGPEVAFFVLDLTLS